MLFVLQVDGQVNPTLQSVHLERFPITTAHFTKDGREVVIAGQRKSFFVYDMVAGKITHIPGIRGIKLHHDTHFKRLYFLLKMCFNDYH